MEPHVSDHVRIFDTTLRDGEQAPGCTMTKDEKLEVARQLARLKVDIMEAGFPATSPGDWDAVNTIAQELGTPDGPIICGLARANKDDIDKCWSAIEPPVVGRSTHVVPLSVEYCSLLTPTSSVADTFTVTGALVYQLLLPFEIDVGAKP